MVKTVISKIKSNREIADKIYEMILEGDFSDYQPGCFVHVKCSNGTDPLLRRPISICDVRNGTELVLLYRAEGKGTTLMSQRQAGEEIDMLAPLGQGFSLDACKGTALLIGGGIGVPPLYYLGRLLVARGLKVKSILGFNATKDVFYAENFAELGETYVTTVQAPSVAAQRHCEEGEAIHAKLHGDRHAAPRLAMTSQTRNDLHYSQGLVTDLLAEVGSWDTLYSCGPTAMLKALQTRIPKEKHAYISLEERMGCGVGACLACVCDLAEPTTKSYARACTEGPVFAMHSVKL